jgi:Fe-S-cluster containining protein
MEGKCSNLKFEDDKYTCSIYSKHPNACRVFPFTLKKQADGNYKLVIHGKCKGYGKGRIINIRQKIQHCLGYSNMEFHKKTRLDFESFDTDRSVVLVFRRD